MNKILLSFDVEEFDLPREHNVEISLEDGIKKSSEGLARILDTLKKNKVTATFFCTSNFAEGAPELIKRIYKEGHEVACHGVDHFNPKPEDGKKSKKILESIVPVKVVGYRQPRMQKINYKNLKEWGFLYDTSVNPAFIPGRYNNLNVPRKPFLKDGLVELPTSVATGMRVPMFWLSLHLFPKKVYCSLAKKVAKRDGYFATYSHPWEFADIMNQKGVQKYIKHNSGEKLVGRLDYLIKYLKKSGCEFVTYAEYINDWRKNEGKD